MKGCRPRMAADNGITDHGLVRFRGILARSPENDNLTGRAPPGFSQYQEHPSGFREVHSPLTLARVPNIAMTRHAAR
jgi:hypothetical protein